jgi:citrate lyase subunit beta/citryl-CoA lyase
MDSKTLKSSSGKRGEDIRSDCYFEVELTKAGGINIEIKSKVASMYGDSIKSIINEMSKFFNLSNADIFIEDSGALPFTIAARFEKAIKELYSGMQKEFFLPMNKKNNYKTTKDRLRRSRLYLPGNEPKFFINAGLHKPDGVILDLEDSVYQTEKDAARFLVRNALRSIDFYGSERMVRINQLPLGLEDLQYIIPHNVHVILIPKCESGEQVKEVEKEIHRIQKIFSIDNEVFLMPIIESAKGVLRSYEIASASNSICALTIGLEDYTADIGTQRTEVGKESFFARSMIVNAAKAAGIQAIDSVYSDVENTEGLRKSVIEAKAMGFEGMGCIHPRQIKVVHESFTPTFAEIEKAKEIVIAFEEAQRKGLGVVSLGSKMIDAPVVKRAKKIIHLALLHKLIDEKWEIEYKF